MSATIVLKPRMSEKSYALSQVRNVFVFDVPGDANKHTVARAVTTQFGVTVEAVNISNAKGKAKRTVRKGGRQSMGRQSDVKKAYVTIAEGQSIPVFAAVEEAEKQEAKTAEATQKALEKAEKKAKKETK